MFSKKMLWLLFWTNGLGTVYGYMWYWGQLVETYERFDRWLLPFVPDSPTASLFFTLSLGFMIADRSTVWHPLLTRRPLRMLRGLIDAFAIITLVKYGIWAVSMNVADNYLAGPISWKQWMLIVSHAGMAVEAVLYARLMRYGRLAIGMIAIWSFANDYVDYHLGVHPYLFGPLEDHMSTIESYTWFLSVFGIVLAWLLYKRRKVVHNRQV